MAYPTGYSVAQMTKYFYENLVDPVTNTLKTSAVISLSSNNVEIVDSAGNPLIGQKAMVGSFPVVIANNQSAVPVSNTVLTDIADGTAHAAKTREVDAAGANFIGQKAMAASKPVVIANNQSAVPVSGTFFQATQPVSGTFWQATQPVSIAANVPVKSPTITWTAFGKTLSGATAEPLAADTACNIIVVKAKSTNSGVMVIAAGTATADNGWECPASTAPVITITGITNMNQVTAIGTSGDKCGGSYGVIS